MQKIGGERCGYTRARGFARRRRGARRRALSGVDGDVHRADRPGLSAKHERRKERGDVPKAKLPGDPCRRGGRAGRRLCGYGAARDADAPAGFGEIRGIYVLRAYQRCGIGKNLLASVAEALRAQGFRKAYLWVLRENDRAIRFYERNGFQFDGVEETDIRAVPVVEKRYSRAL